MEMKDLFWVGWWWWWLKGTLNRRFCKKKPFDFQSKTWLFQLNLVHMC